MGEKLTDLQEKTRESVQVRGIAAALQAMNMPTFKSLRDLLGAFGYGLFKDKTRES